MTNRRDDSIQLSFNLLDKGIMEKLNAQLERMKTQLDQVNAQNAGLIQENKLLKEQLRFFVNQENINNRNPSKVIISEEVPNVSFSDHEAVTKYSSIDQKIKLYRYYFRGRDDVYAVRGIDKQGKPAYFRKRQLLSKENGNYIWGEDLPLTDDVIKNHIEKEDYPITVGIFPMLQNETCWFLAVDFDKSTWQADATAFMETCSTCNVPAALERSRSGNGGHVWFFFAEPVPARTARMMGSALLTMTLEKRNQIGLDSYDRMFPNQDTLPRDKKLGNLIALPFQRLPGKSGNSLFIDSSFEPYKDQWIYLSSVRKIKLSEVDEVVNEAQRRGNILRIVNPSIYEDEMVSDKPWKVSSRDNIVQMQLPVVIRAVLSNLLYIEKMSMSSSQLNIFIRMAAFQNPEFYRAQKMRLSTRGKPRVINCTEDFPDYLALPRGCLDEVTQLLQEQRVTLELQDERYSGTRIEVDFRGDLREKQQDAVRELAKYDTGVLSATTAFGKTVVGLWMIAARKTNTLILVHRAQLMDQWKTKIAEFLDISAMEVGQISGGKNKRTGIVDVAMLQTVQGRGEVKDYIAEYGQIIVDECHHVSAFSFEQVLKHAKAKYVLGLTATLTRKDGHQPIVLMHCGPVRYRTDAKAEAEERPFRHVVIPRHTSFTLTDSEKDLPIHELYDRIIADDQRNEIIFDDLLKALDKGRSPILLTDRTSHLEYFERRLQGFAKNIIVLRGGMGKKQWKQVQDNIRSIPSDQERVMLATGRFAGEGFDDARLDTLFLVMPFSWKGTFHQYAGRLHRLYEGKREVQIYDYVDDRVPLFKRMHSKRSSGYLSLGYTIHQEVSDHELGEKN